MTAEDVGEVGKDKLLVASHLSAISAGSELLVLRDEFPPDLTLDSAIPDLKKPFGYPLKYGYAIVGEVIDAGFQAGANWAGKRVFVFHPHESHFVVSPEEVVVLPDDLTWEDAVLLPFMETAVNFLMDGRPVIGEQVAVFGQGPVGLLTTALLARLPLGGLITMDRYPLRRRLSLELGAETSFDPVVKGVVKEARLALNKSGTYEGADLTYEVSGNPAALNHAVEVTGFSGRVVIGSWYGRKKGVVDLGGYFHRNRINIISSQVSTVTPAAANAWTQGRRIAVALRMLALMRPSRIISHTLPFPDAQRAYEMLDRQPGEVVQVVLAYR